MSPRRIRGFTSTIWAVSYAIRISAVVACAMYVATMLACGGASPHASASSSPSVETMDAGADDLSPLPPQLENRAVVAPGYTPGLAREWKVCVLDELRTRDLRCGKELLWETVDLPNFRVSNACRALTSSVGATCVDSVTKKVNSALPTQADTAACRDAFEDVACNDVAEDLKNPLFTNHGGEGCAACGRAATDFVFGANRAEPVPASNALPFSQSALDAIYARVDAGFGAVAAQTCAHARGPDDCSELKRIADAHPTNPDAASWQRTLARMQPKMDEAQWAQVSSQRCVQQHDQSDETECAKIRGYLALFPQGHHVTEARAALAQSEAGRAARQHADQVEDCKRSCASPPRDWGMSPGPANCARILGRPCQ
jgi:hypothetical protein